MLGQKALELPPAAEPASSLLADSCSQRVAQAEISFVQRPSQHHSHPPRLESRPKSANVVETRHAARRDNWNAPRPGDFFHPGRIDAHLRAIAGDVRRK